MRCTMSRYILTEAEGPYSIIVGYDRPLDHFFAQVWNAHGTMVLGADAILGYRSITELNDAVAPYATLPDELLGDLVLDRDIGTPERCNRQIVWERGADAGPTLRSPRL